MRILFISREKKAGEVSIIIHNQGHSLVSKGVAVSYYPISGSGFIGYIKSIKQLFNIRKSYDIFHAHYSLTGFIVALAFCKPTVVSLMGSEVYSHFAIKYLIRVFAKFIWSKTIVKSKKIKDELKIKSCSVIPNGVDLGKFKPIERYVAQQKLGWDYNKKHILFASDPDRFEKNYPLAKSSIDLLSSCDIEIHFIKNKPNEKLYLYYSACNVLLLTSLWEGSPNVIKEGMACNAQIVSTDVGDVKELFGYTYGLAIVDNSPKNIANALLKAISMNNRSEGRNRIVELGIDSSSIADSLIYEYNKIRKH
ncbi:MAG: glycosyltransferase [Bacteroidetes bacterium]|nr:glycosyltransferase [Bacteroidota bacterium]